MSIYDCNKQNEAQDGLAASPKGDTTSPKFYKLINDPKAQAYRKEEAAWSESTEQLTDWVIKNLVVRTDAYGKHYVRKDGSSGRCTMKEPLDRAILRRHFFKSDPVVGVFTTSIENQCRFLLIDIDCHGQDDELAQRNFEFALKIDVELSRLGISNLLLDSNGMGGFHLIVLFNEQVPARVARSFGRWLVRDHRDFRLEEPEVFPKQDTIKGKFGNLVRVFGKHHKRSFFTKVWDEQKFVKGKEAIGLIIEHKGNAARLIPEVAASYQPKKTERPSNGPTPGKHEGNWWLAYDGDLRTLDLVGLLESEGRDVIPRKDKEHSIECPWAKDHTTGDDSALIKEAVENEGRFPVFHCFHAHCRQRRLKHLLELFDRDIVDAHCRVQFKEDRPVVVPTDPFETAKTYHDGLRSREGLPTLFHRQGVWQGWDGQKYIEMSDDDIRASMWRWLKACSCWTKASKLDESTLVPFVPNRSQVTAVIDALKAVSNLEKSQEMPSWLIEGEHPAPTSIIAFQNGLLDVESHLESRGETLLPHSPGWFSATCLPHRFTPQAQCPTWLHFLNEVFEEDQERIDTLAEWFGYNLTWETRHQKFVMLVGPPRSGKGTTMSVLTEVLGHDNVANPSLTSLGGQFGLASLVGKQAAVIGDGHLGRHSDSIGILERLKSIVGCDPQDIDRKYRTALTNIVINARFTISVNEVPRLPDASAALRSRLILLPFNRSFEGRENVFLFDHLAKEIPGITNWALDGLKRLRSAGKFAQPEAGKPIVEEFVRASSPVQAFVDDWCDVGCKQSVSTQLLQFGWKEWCEQNGHEAGSNISFGTKLRAALPMLDRQRVREGDCLRWEYRGIGLKQGVSDRLRLLRQTGGM